MNPDLGLREKIIFPVIEKGIEVLYITDAGVDEITHAFQESNNTSKFIRSIEGQGHKINRYRSGVRISFD